MLLLGLLDPLITFAYLALLVLVLVFLHSYYRRRSIKQIVNFNLNLKRWFILGSIIILVCVLSIVGLYRPALQERRSKAYYEGARVVLIVDVSLSMRAEDTSGDVSRLGAVRNEIEHLFQKSKGDKFGITIFAGEAVPWLPFLSEDKTFLKFYLERLSTDIIRTRGTDIGAALFKATDMVLQDEEGPAIILLFSDGELKGVKPKTLAEAVKKVKKHDIKLYSIGVGSRQGAKIPVDGKFLETEEGQIAYTKLNERNLMFLADACNGDYVHIDNLKSAYSLIEDNRSLEYTKEVTTTTELTHWVGLMLVILLILFLIL